MLKKTVVVLCALSVLSGYSFARPVSYNFSEKTPANSAIRSLILPGWGQYFNDHKTKGYIIGGSVLLTLVGSYTLYTKANNTYDDYEKLGVKDGSLYDDYVSQSAQAMVGSLICLGLWVYAVVDAYKLGEKAQNEKTSSAGFIIACSNDKTALYYSKRF